MPVELPTPCEHETVEPKDGLWFCTTCEAPFVPLESAQEELAKQAHFYDGQMDLAVKVAADAAARVVHAMYSDDLDDRIADDVKLPPTPDEPVLKSPFIGISDEEYTEQQRQNASDRARDEVDRDAD